MASSTVHVEGLRELQRAFGKADARLKRELVKTLKEVAEPVRVDAESLAVTRIPKAGMTWSRMRVGVTANSVYIAPKTKGRRHSRPNFGLLLMGRSMKPAVEQNEQNILEGLEDWLDDIGRDWEQ